MNTAKAKLKISVLRVTRQYLTLLVKLKIFSGFLEKCIILCVLKGENINLIPEKKIVCLPDLKLSGLLPERHKFFIWPNPFPSIHNKMSALASAYLLWLHIM